MNKNRISIHVTSKDRHSEIALLLQSLRTQTYQEFDIVLLDDGSGTPLTTHGPTMSLINRMKLEDHKFKLLRNNISNGVCAARNKCIDDDRFNNELTLRLDDDVVLESSYIDDLMEVIIKGFDCATGTVPLTAYPELKRGLKHMGDIVCEHKFNDKGELIERQDELAYCYLNDGTSPGIKLCHQFRTNALYKTEITDRGVRYPDTLTKTGFREELWFSFRAQILGYTIGVNLYATCYHFQTPSGGCRSETYGQNVALDEETTNKWIKQMYKKHGNFLK